MESSMKANTRLNISSLVISILGLALSGFSGYLLYSAEEKSIIGELQRDVDKRASLFFRQLSINFETLQSLAILFRGETTPDNRRFQNEARRILSRHGDIQALEWIPRIIHSERAQYVSIIRRYFPDYEISKRQAQGIMVRTEEKQEYYPVYFVEPLVGNEAAMGFDLSSSPARLEALEKSRDRDIPQATASITLVQENGTQKGFLAFLPIFKGDPLTVEHRRESLIGFVLGVYRIGDIFTSSALHEKMLGIELKLVDETRLPDSKILYTHKSRTGFPADMGFTYRKELPEILGRKWVLIASPTVSYIALRRSMLPQMIFIIGIVLTAFIVMHFRMISQRTAIIQEKVIEQTNKLSEANKKLKFLSRNDGLTGIANRRHMDKILDTEWLRAIRNKSSISFLLIDIDFFKTYNDNYGHLMGDECLKKVAKTIKEIPNRPTDSIARYGGEEFALVLAETRMARTVAEDCRRSIEDLGIRHNFSEAADVVTISVGVCTCAPGHGADPRIIIDSADKALYQAKKKGRNRVEMTELGQKVHLYVL